MRYIYTFRLLLVLEVLLTIAFPFVMYYTMDSLPPEIQQYLNSSGDENGLYDYIDALPSNALLALGIGLLVVLLGSLIGLWLMLNWARHLYVAITIIGFAFLPLDIQKPYIATGAESYLLDILNLITGVMIAMMYLPPLADRFKSRKWWVTTRT